MTRPRNSILDLFDPLTTSAAQDRQFIRADSPGWDSETGSTGSASDKENSAPDPITASAFFRRTSNHGPGSKPPSPVRLRKRLVDVGDVTADDELSTSEENTHPEEATENRETENKDVLDENFDLLQCTMPRSPARSPLADISLDLVPKKAPSKREETATTLNPSPLRNSTVPSPQNAQKLLEQDSPLASAASRAFFDEVSRSPENSQPVTPDSGTLRVKKHTPKTPLHTSVPQIQLDSVSPDRDTQEEENYIPALLSPFSMSTALRESVIEDAPIPPPVLRPRRSVGRKSSLGHSRRESADLHASFTSQMLSADASFDLINDRISFFGNDVLLSFGDEDFDMKKEEENLNALVEAASKEISSLDQDTPVFPPKPSTPPPSTIFSDIETPELDFDVSKIKATSSARVSLAGPDACASPEPTAQDHELVSEASISSSECRAPSPSAPAPPAAPAIPALRIVKRSCRTQSSSDIPSALALGIQPIEPKPTRAPLVVRRASVAQAPVPPATSVSAAGNTKHMSTRSMSQIQRPPKGAMLLPSLSIKKPKATGLSTSAASNIARADIENAAAAPPPPPASKPTSRLEASRPTAARQSQQHTGASSGMKPPSRFGFFNNASASAVAIAPSEPTTVPIAGNGSTISRTRPNTLSSTISSRLPSVLSSAASQPSRIGSISRRGGLIGKRL